MPQDDIATPISQISAQTETAGPKGRLFDRSRQGGAGSLLAGAEALVLNPHVDRLRRGGGLAVAGIGHVAGGLLDSLISLMTNRMLGGGHSGRGRDGDREQKSNSGLVGHGFNLSCGSAHCWNSLDHILLCVMKAFKVMLILVLKQ